MKMVLLFACLSFAFVCASCTEWLVGPEPPQGAVANFDALWRDIDLHYSTFELKDIDWDSAYRRLRPSVYEGMGDKALARVMDTLLSTLHDAHVNLITPFQAFSYSKLMIDTPAYFGFIRLIKEYLGSAAEVAGNGNLMHGFINDSIAYLNIATFSNTSRDQEWEKDLDGVLNKLQSAKGLIIDIRNNGGGEVFRLLDILGHFTNESYPFIRMRSRNGPKHNDFSDWFTVSVSPTGSVRYTKKIVLLTSPYSVSAAEWFTVGLRRLSYVTVLGDTTQGAMSGRSDRELPNGWLYSYSTQIVADADFKIYEGKGIPPDSTIHVTDSQDSTRHDTVLEAALGVLSR